MTMFAAFFTWSVNRYVLNFCFSHSVSLSLGFQQGECLDGIYQDPDIYTLFVRVHVAPELLQVNRTLRVSPDASYVNIPVAATI